ncbi:hypothetical protein CRG98_010250 [Punica granatum]|uniref:Uncharacterized protein n=1 Tax=Punica granatum TaxID=22663 RepID=A0A2I0KLJ2_PUNGR|nr:hypothetical protein CRG98_010250 [Punica granatum]
MGARLGVREHARARQGVRCARRCSDAREPAAGKRALGRTAVRGRDKTLMSIDEELIVVFNLSKIFWLREGKLASCIEKEEAEISKALRRNREKARVSIDRTFEARGSN